MVSSRLSEEFVNGDDSLPALPREEATTITGTSGAALAGSRGHWSGQPAGEVFGLVTAGGYDERVTAEAHNPFYASPVPALPPETSPSAIRDALIDEERTEFERAYQEAMIEAARTLDLTEVLDVLRSYHRIAWLTRRHGPEAHRRMLDKAAEILRTGSNPDAVSVDEVMTLIDKRLGR